MKKLALITIVLTMTTSAFGLPGQLGEVDPKECECETCLIKHGVCVRTLGQGIRHPSNDKGNANNKASKALKQGKAKSL
jgi:hypothetical protein